MSKKKVKKQKTEKKKPNIFMRASKSISSTVSSWNGERKHRKVKKQEMKELAMCLADDIKVQADKIALLELAKRQEKRAAELRLMAEEIV